MKSRHGTEWPFAAAGLICFKHVQIGRPTQTIKVEWRFCSTQHFCLTRGAWMPSNEQTDHKREEKKKHTQALSRATNTAGQLKLTGWTVTVEELFYLLKRQIIGNNLLDRQGTWFLSDLIKKKVICAFFHVTVIDCQKYARRPFCKHFSGFFPPEEQTHCTYCSFSIRFYCPMEIFICS